MGMPEGKKRESRSPAIWRKAVSASLVLAAILVAVSAGCDGIPGFAGSVRPGGGIASSWVVKMILADGTEKDFPLAELGKMPMSRMFLEERWQEGPSIAEVLKSAGVTEYRQVTLVGSSSSLMLTREQVGDDALLHFNNHGTVRLASPKVEKAAWVKDVGEIKVE
jgi:hypothetical protein